MLIFGARLRLGALVPCVLVVALRFGITALASNLALVPKPMTLADEGQDLDWLVWPWVSTP